MNRQIGNTHMYPLNNLGIIVFKAFIFISVTVDCATLCMHGQPVVFYTNPANNVACNAASNICTPACILLK